MPMSYEVPGPEVVTHWAQPFACAHWHDVVRRRDALPALDHRSLLHAGPPLDGPMPGPMRQAAVQALLYEGMAEDIPAALALLALREVQLLPAQDHGVVTPLAQVVSASMPLAAVGDGRCSAWAPLVEGAAPALRFGDLDPAVVTRMRAISTMGLERLAPLLRANPLPLSRVIVSALRAGDDCHSRTGSANAALLREIIGLDDKDRAELAHNAGFVLTILMAAASWRLRRPDQRLAAVGGNGHRFGFRLHGESSWRTAFAAAPMGTRLNGHTGTDALGAIGDSAVIDFCGLGGQALAAAPELRAAWRELLPADLLAHRAAVTDAATGLVPVERMRAGDVVPMVNLAILDASGRAGLIGRGVFKPERSLFLDAGARSAPP
jgi:hypothetical protein